jgi:hypothetical protein
MSKATATFHLYASMIPPDSACMVKMQREEPGACAVLDNVTESHYGWSWDDRGAVCAAGMAFVYANAAVLRRIRSGLMTPYEREAFRLIAVHNSEYNSAQRGNMLAQLADTL